MPLLAHFFYANFLCAWMAHTYTGKHTLAQLFFPQIKQQRKNNKKYSSAASHSHLRASHQYTRESRHHPPWRANKKHLTKREKLRAIN